MRQQQVLQLGQQKRQQQVLVLVLPLAQERQVQQEQRQENRSCLRAGRRFGMRSMKGTTTITKLLKRQHGRSLHTDHRRWCRHRRRPRCPLPRRLPVM